ncbi:hypothetical protein B0T20DRAFT_461480 [Sordaria brevicollis]|uniref:Uncharacterized protein n=1 Tax=Sordaria brevicollis TaxID=83679 RepID=A0AAE0UB14_SORBR|nr:hypothetical protein B0T20DRAFT_461480 [Sordaria brevicollis]
MMDDVILERIEPAPDAPEITYDDNSLQKQIEALQQQMEASNKAHLAELAKIQSHAAACEEELQFLRQLSTLARPTKDDVHDNITEIQDPDSMDQDDDIPYWPYDEHEATTNVSFAQFCNYFATGPYLSQQDWDLIVPYMNEQRPVNFRENEAPAAVIDEFWEVGDTWGADRTSFHFLESDGDCDWRNTALLSVRQLMRDMLGKRMAYVGLVRLIGDTVAELVTTNKLQKDDPLLFAIWQLAAFADELATRFLSMEHRTLGASLAGAWSDITEVILLQIQEREQHNTKNLCPFELVLQATLKAKGIPYFHTSKTGVIARRDVETGQRQYILLDFDSKSWEQFMRSLNTSSL